MGLEANILYRCGGWGSRVICTGRDNGESTTHRPDAGNPVGQLPASEFIATKWSVFVSGSIFLNTI